VSKRGRSIVWLVGLILLGAIGVLWGISISGRTPAEIKAELEAKIEALNKIPAEEAVRKDALAEEMMDNEEYKNHAKALWLKLERAHRSLHDAAQLEKAAAKEVPPFLARSKEFSKLLHEDLKILIGEARTLINNYGSTRFGDPLRKRMDELTAALDSLPKPVTAREFLDLSGKVTMAQKQGHFSDAIALIEDFMKRPGAKEYATQAAGLTETTNTKAGSAADAMLEKARMYFGRKDRASALSLLERSEPDFRRFPNVMSAIEALRRTIKSR
jgi:hypothetical protein